MFFCFEQIYDRIARVEHVDHARRSAHHCVKALLTAQTHTYVTFNNIPVKCFFFLVESEVFLFIMVPF